MRIILESIPHAQQRYDTLGDWISADDGTVYIRASEEEGEDEAFLIALHELVEFWLCKKEGVSQEAVDTFDLAYKGDGEPGEEPLAPYRTQHRRAALIEHMAAYFMGLDNYGEVR